MKRYMGLLICLIFAVSCSTIDVSYDFDQELNFSTIKTFDWMPVPEKAQVNELTIKHIKYAVSRELQAKGLQITSINPDMLIAFHAGKEKKVDVQEWGYVYDDHEYYHWRPSYQEVAGGPSGRDYLEYRRGTETYEYEIGTLILDFVDAKKKSLIWRGTARSEVDPGRSSEQINDAVKKILVNFPPMMKK